MKIHETLKQVNDYFVNKIVKGQFIVTKIDEHHVSVQINKKYDFVIWTASGVDCIETYNSYSEPNTMNLDFTESEKISIWRRMKKIIKKHNDTVVLEREREQFAKVKKELNM